MLTENAVSASQALAREHSVSECTEFVADYHSLGNVYRSGQFDAIIMTNSLCHSTKPWVVISEAYRCLKGSGLLLIKDLFSEGAISILDNLKF